ncbi:MAG: Preprotein translocase, SecG subunit [Candidatus Peregrinibacteria bacterium GW2011_GWA2_47_7]|nr:MAG: Preprotein translocase, SecG subunit [Candidatus Peregrinibacteria bacterium GW2011_GWA2_47_7]
MKEFLVIAQIVISILLVVSILSQERGSGLSAAFGGGGDVYRSKRGVDRILTWITVALAVLFIVSSLSFAFIKEPNAGVPSVSAGTATGATVTTEAPASDTTPEFDVVDFEAVPVEE